MLVRRLEAAGCDVIRTKEPDGGPIGREIRAIMVKGPAARLEAVEELLLVSAARSGHVREVIRPALVRGRWVVSDRFADSSFALQVKGGGVSESIYRAVTAAVVGECMPQLTFILDMPAEVASMRRTNRGANALADPAETTRNFDRIRDGFLEVARREPNRCRVIDATAPTDEVHGAIWSEISGLI